VATVSAAVVANLAVVGLALWLQPRFASDAVVRVLVILYAWINIVALAGGRLRTRYLSAGFRARRIALVTNAGLAVLGLAFAAVSFDGLRSIDSALPLLLPVPAALNLLALRVTR
jgi:hypothetical protein